jgi:CheY-like chemotaxis protein
MIRGPAPEIKPPPPYHRAPMDAATAPPLLLAEDDPTSARFLVEALRQLGWSVEHAADGPAALAAGRARRHAAWLFDLGLPGLDGRAVLRALRADGLGVPALALSADTDAALRRDVLAEGFADLLPKPLGIARLEAALRGLGAVRDDAGTGTPPMFDDAAALEALGSPEAVADLRGLFVRELPGQAARVEAAIRAGAAEDALGELHRLKASTRFCGALALAAAVDVLATALREDRGVDPARTRWREALDATQRAFSSPGPPPAGAATTP